MPYSDQIYLGGSLHSLIAVGIFVINIDTLMGQRETGKGVTVP